jgi:hypothetical protein
MSNIHAPPWIYTQGREQNLDATSVLGGGESAYNPRRKLFHRHANPSNNDIQVGT